MEVLFKICGVMLVSGCAAMLLRKSNPEISLTISAASLVLVFGAALTMLRPVRDIWEKAQDLFGVGDAYLLPLVKCCAAAIIAKLTADLCRESSQIAAASAVEYFGVLCALGAAMPLIANMLSAVGEIL